MPDANVYGNLKSFKNVKKGIGEFALIARKDWITTLKAPVAPFTNRGDSITIKADHVFGKDADNNDYAFMKFALAPGKNKLGVKNSGDTGLKSPSTTVSIFVPGSYEEAHETVRNLMNQPLLVIVKDAECAAGLYYNLGDDCTSAYMDYEFDTATTADGVKGFSVTISYDDAFLFYKPVAAIPVMAD